MTVTSNYGFPHIDQLKNKVYTSSFEGTLNKICSYVVAFFQDLGHNLSLFFNSLFGRVESSLPEHEAALNALTSLQKDIYVRKAVAATMIDSLELSHYPLSIQEPEGEPSNQELSLLFKDLIAAKETEGWKGFFTLPTVILSGNAISAYEEECERILVHLKPFLDLIEFPSITWAGYARVSEAVLNAINNPKLTTLWLSSEAAVLVDAPLIKRCCPSLKTLIIPSLLAGPFLDTDAVRENRTDLARFTGFEIRVSWEGGVLLNPVQEASV